MMRICRLMVTMTVCAVLGMPGLVFADLAPNGDFGQNGMVLTKLGLGSDEAAAIAVQEDGRIVVAGSTDTGIDRDMAVVRYLPSGEVDPDFLFSAGRLIGPELGDDGVKALTVLDDGTLILAGFITEYDRTSAVLVKLLANGQLDYRFGEQGVAVAPVGGVDTQFQDIHLMTDGKIAAVGSVVSGETAQPLVARFSPDGSPDQEFGDGGLQRVETVSGVLHAVTADDAGNLLACGFATDDGQRNGLLLLRLTNGQPDATFGSEGMVVVFNSEEQIIGHDLALQQDGSLVIAGEVGAVDGRRSVLIGRFSADGQPDLTLSDDGLLVHDLGQDSAAYAVAVMPDNTVVAAGYRQLEGEKDTIILTFDTSLALLATPESPTAPKDETPIVVSQLAVEEGAFSEAAALSARSPQQADLLTTAVAGSDEVSYAITAQADGTVYTAGSSGTEGETAIMVAGYAAADDQTADDARETAPVYSTYYAIETTPITVITRVGALTGGAITQLAVDTETCIAVCQAACPEDGTTDSGTDAGTDAGTDSDPTVDDDTDPGTESTTETVSCADACVESCAIPTVTQRGVVYSVTPGPVYTDGDATSDGEDSGGDDDGDGVDAGDTSGDDQDGGDATGDLTDANPLGSGNLLLFDDYLVKKGQTEDGSGAGVFTSEIEQVNPQTVYYVRAYAVLSDGSVIYGNELFFKTDDACFIATAAFGSIDHVAVRALRLFRDRYLKPFAWGQSLITVYYQVSPPLAELVAAIPLLRLAALWLLLPLAAGALLLVYLPVVGPYLLVAWWLHRSYQPARNRVRIWMP
ncbi:MAG: hypothetical protein KQH59_21010 [Desulfobulbaceae bacterium]|nr:hypothetical protein [Desulfobulbaceae bacterium]